MAVCVGLKSNDTFVSADGYIIQSSDDLYLSILSIADKRKIVINNIVYRVMVDLNLYKKESE